MRHLVNPRSCLPWLLLASVVAAGVPSVAHAETGKDRPFYFSFAMGPTVPLESGWPTQLKLQEDIGYHLVSFGNHPGLFIGGSLGQSFIDATLLQFDGRFGVDLAVYDSDDIAILITPSFALGVGAFITRFGRDFAAFNVQFAGDVKLVLADGVVALFARPLGIDIFIEDGSLVRWDFLFGVQINL